MSNRTTEKAIETAILMYLNYLPGCFAWKNNSTGIFDQARGCYRKSKNKYAINGVSDILGVYQGRFLAIEVKKPGAPDATDEQKNFIKRIGKSGGIAGVARSVDDAREILKQQGVYNERTNNEGVSG